MVKRNLVMYFSLALYLSDNAALATPPTYDGVSGEGYVRIEETDGSTSRMFATYNVRFSPYFGHEHSGVAMVLTTQTDLEWVDHWSWVEIWGYDGSTNKSFYCSVPQDSPQFDQVKLIATSANDGAMLDVIQVNGLCTYIRMIKISSQQH